jgi:hypothetical protein
VYLECQRLRFVKTNVFDQPVKRAQGCFFASDLYDDIARNDSDCLAVERSHGAPHALSDTNF